VNVALLTPIVFLSPLLLLAAFSFPWPRLVARLRRRPYAAAPPDAPSFDLAPARAPRAAAEAAALAAVLVLGAWLSPIRAYTALHHDGRHGTSDRRAPASPPPADVAALLGGLGPGAPVASLQVARVEVRDLQIRIELAGAGGGSMRVAIARTGALGFHALRASASYEIFYEAARGVDDAARDAVLAAVEARLRENEGSAPVPRGL